MRKIIESVIKPTDNFDCVPEREVHHIGVCNDLRRFGQVHCKDEEEKGMALDQPFGRDHLIGGSLLLSRYLIRWAGTGDIGCYSSDGLLIF